MRMRTEIPGSACKNTEIINLKIKDNHLKNNRDHHLTAYYVVGTYISSFMYFTDEEIDRF